MNASEGKGKGEGRIGLAACLRKMSAASSCFLNEPGWGREVGRALFYKHPCGTGGRSAQCMVSVKLHTLESYRVFESFEDNAA